MMTVPLHGGKAAGRVIEVDDSDYDQTVAYRWHVQERRHPNGRIDGPYAATNLPRNGGRSRTLLLHRLLLPGARRIDHEDGNGLNCQRSNMRDATAGQNGANSGSRAVYGGRPTSSRFKGVSWHKAAGKWRAAIIVNRRKRHLGLFADEAEAARVYDVAALEAWGSFARLNFPVGSTS